MQLNLVGCSHHTATLAVREQLAFTREQVRDALAQLRSRFPRTEAVLLSTCNRVELYTAAVDPVHAPTPQELIQFLAEYHGLASAEIAPQLTHCATGEAIRHLFAVAASLDSMVLGEAQILSQVKEAYQLATDGDCTGPLTNSAFQAALRVARRVAHETTIHQRRVSIPSVAVADFARQVFERFDDKLVLILGAGKMGAETARYLVDEGARQIVVCTRNPQRGQRLADRFQAGTATWDQLPQLLAEADLIVSTTGSRQPIVTWDVYQRVQSERHQRPLFILDLAVPRDFDPRIGQAAEVYLFTIDDLQETCAANRRQREKEWPRAQKIIDEETERFLADWNHRATGPTIRRLRDQANAVKQDELLRLLNRIAIDPRGQGEIEMAFDRLVNKLLHPPLESLRDEAEKGPPHGLLEALRRLFQLKD
jgi:glutamyl-tRNA reductase